MMFEISPFWMDRDENGRSMLELVALNANDGIWDLEVPTGRSLYSPRWWELVGLSPDREAHFDVFLHLLHPDDKERVVEALQSFIKGHKAEYRIEFRLRHRLDTWRWIRSSGAALRDAQGVAYRVIGTHTDISDRMEAEDRLEKLVVDRTRDLAAARDRAEIAAASTNKFLSVISHDIRQPLQAMALLLGSLHSEVTTPSGAKTIAGIRRSLVASMELLDDLLEFSRLDAGALRPEMRAIPIRSLFQSLDGFAIEARERGLRFVVKDTHLAGRTDPRLLGRILRNLVSNSFKFTTRGTILIAARPRGSAVRIEVWDTGRGIAPEQHREIFWEFTQGDLSDASDLKQRGLGLGLAIVKRLARLLNHEVGMRSSVAQGSVFWIDLPRVASGAVQTPSERTPPLGTPLNCRVAVAENDPEIADAYMQLLRGWGCRVLVARSAQELLSQMAGEAPDLLIADWHLDGAMNGFEIFDELETLFATKIPGVVVSGDHSFDDIREINHEKRRVLIKPILPEVLNAVLHSEFETKAATNPSSNQTIEARVRT